ncbi:unnamed protein product [Rodentolepis nana]|uniref:Tetraspanin n=1 Tax=Rodentolepis nana TaxID=102285 RepID=A0A158QHN2_RODNA|nr:unnamed protein product [Rodentolepis nana]
MPKVTITGCFKCVKYALFAFCLIAWVSHLLALIYFYRFFILGLVAFIWGIVARATGHFGPLETHLPAVANGANLLIAVGFIIMFVGFLGCCGAIRESQTLLFSGRDFGSVFYLFVSFLNFKMLDTFFLSIYLCFILLMAAGLWAVAWKPRVPVYLHGSLEKLIQSYKTDGNSDDIKLLNFIQAKVIECIFSYC